MKRASLISFAVFFTIAGQAAGDSQWADAEIFPQNPTSSDVVVITLSGQWGSSCIPNSSTVTVTDNDIYFDVIWDYPPDIGCYTVMTPWELRRSVGPLTPGTYSVYARVTGYPYYPDTYTMMAEFTVTTDYHVDTVYYVDAVTGDDDNDGLSPTAAFATIQKAIDMAKSGDTIIVAEGLYLGEGNYNIDFYCKAVTVRSVDPNDANAVASTIVDCNGVGYGFNFRSNEGPNSVLAGLTITNGIHGIHCRDYSSPTISHCVILDNSVGRFGVGIWCDNSSPRITNSVVSSNTSIYGRGIYTTYKSDITITNCIITGNTSDHGAGIFCEKDSSLTIKNCTISGNSSTYRGGGIYLRNSNAVITNCVISGNMAKYYCGGGMFCFASNTSITNCTFAQNVSARGNALACDSWSRNYPSNLRLTNCILADDGDEIWNDDGSTIAVNYNDVQAGWPGQGNIDTDPCFVDPAYGDYHLSDFSPCIDAGDPNYIPGPNETDLDGKPRVLDGNEDDTAVVDMGAYEYGSLPPVEAVVKIHPGTLNLRSKGRWLTCYILLPQGCNAADIDPNSVLLEDEIPADRVVSYGRLAMAKFSRPAVHQLLSDLQTPAEVELLVSGQLIDGTIFEGTDTITLINAPSHRKQKSTSPPPPPKPKKHRKSK